MTPLGPVLALKVVVLGMWYVADGMVVEGRETGIWFSSWLERRVVLSLSDEESRASSGWEVNFFSWVSYMASNSSWAALGMLKSYGVGIWNGYGCVPRLLLSQTQDQEKRRRSDVAERMLLKQVTVRFVE